MSSSTDVVVIGAGPVGLFLAIELTLAGVRPLVLERLERPDLTLKAGGINAVATEVLARRGFGTAIRTAEVKVLETMGAFMSAHHSGSLDTPFHRSGGHFSGLFLIDQTRQRAPERRMSGVVQSELEALLLARARMLNIDVRRGEELCDFAQDESEGVTLQLRNARGRYTLHTQYLVGCDGGRSLVRKRSGIDFVGTDPTFTGYQALATLDHPERLAPGWQHTERGTVAHGPTPGRIMLISFDGPPPPREVPVTRDAVEQALRSVSGADVRILRLEHATRWSDNTRQAISYRKGRVLLAGDSAHVHSPFGGQGLALGLSDAANLGWKLAAAARNEAPNRLLESYEAERHPIAARVLDNTRAQTALMRPDPQTSALREIVSDIMKSDWGTRYFGELISGLYLRYDLGDPHPDVGTLAADRVVEGDSLYSLMREGSALLIDGSGEASAVAAPWRSKVRCVRTQGRSQLIRPDGCIAWVGDGTSGLHGALTRWFHAA
ncbi:MAG: Salicylate hydroxylase [Myxococcaceae bacterium]|nr:Salicylate hydroxylase [Myxococcaceae bacterium]